MDYSDKLPLACSFENRRSCEFLGGSLVDLKRLLERNRRVAQDKYRDENRFHDCGSMDDDKGVSN